MAERKQRVHKLAIIGGGPAGIGIIVRAARIGALDDLLGKNNDSAKGMGVVLIHKGDSASLGRGKLGEYIIHSNTFARSMTSSVLEDKLNLDPVEMATGTYLESLRVHRATLALSGLGQSTAPLKALGAFLAAVGEKTQIELKKRPNTSSILLNTEALSLQMIEGHVKITVRSKDGLVSVVFAERVVLATGGVQYKPDLGSPALNCKLFASDDVLRPRGYFALLRHLEKGQNNKVCIVGGSHSAFSVGWALLNPKVCQENGVDSSPIVEFMAREISLVHRSPIRCFYATAKEALTDGATFCSQDRSGAINTFSGLRTDAKALYKAIKAGKESRIRLFKVGRSPSIQTRCYEEATAIVWCCGYKTASIPVYDIDGKEMKLENARGQLPINIKGQIVSSVKNSNEVSDRLMGIGVGFALTSPTPEMLQATRSDGVAVYQKRGASLVLSAVLGTHVFGTNCTTYEEMMTRQELDRKETGKESTRTFLQQNEVMNRYIIRIY